jgi:hypothetical protein
VLGPDANCLWCIGVIDEARLRAEQLPPEQAATQRGFGYIPDLDIPAPSVVSINGVVASLAVTELVARVVGLRSSAHDPSTLLYRLSDGTVRRVGPQQGSCGFCMGPAVRAADTASLPTRPGRGSPSDDGQTRHLLHLAARGLKRLAWWGGERGVG